MEWIKPTNTKYFNHWKALEELNEMYWRDNVNFEVGDIVYLYSAKPETRITHKCIVIESCVDLERAQSINDDKYLNGNKGFVNYQEGKYHRLKLIKSLYSDQLEINRLIQYGLPKAPQSTQRLSQEIVDYLEEVFNNENIFPNEIQDNEVFIEGSVQQVYVNKYERNPKARLECINYCESYKCQICDFDFVKVYGEIGKGFIHVHHLKPLFMMGKSYKLNPITDLIPLCPNCHAMLHRKFNDKYLTVDELRQIIKDKKELTNV